MMGLVAGFHQGGAATLDPRDHAGARATALARSNITATARRTLCSRECRAYGVAHVTGDVHPSMIMRMYLKFPIIQDGKKNREAARRN